MRRFAKERMVDALGCAAVDTYFYVTMDKGTAEQASDDFTPAPNATVEAVHAAAREFDPVSVTLHVRDDSLKSDEDDAHAQLSKAAACYDTATGEPSAQRLEVRNSK